MTEPQPQLPPSLLIACYAEARRTYPREACGLLCGRRGAMAIDTLRVCENDQDRLHALDPLGFPRDGRTAFRLRFVDVLWLYESLQTDVPARILFHSHVDVGAAFSAQDRAEAQRHDVLRETFDHLVVDVLADGARGALRYRFVDGDFRCIARYDAQGRFLQVDSGTN